MGNNFSSSGVASVPALFDNNILRCNHSPRLELDVPEHAPCGTCCRYQPCADHDEDPANQQMVVFKNYISQIVRQLDVHDVAVHSTANRPAQPVNRRDDVTVLQHAIEAVQRHTPGVDQPGNDEVTLLLYRCKFLLCIIISLVFKNSWR